MRCSAQPSARAALDDEDWTALSVAVVQRQAQAEGDSGGNIAAAGIVAEGLKRLGRQPALLQTYEAYVHNAFAMLFNARKRGGCEGGDRPGSRRLSRQPHAPAGPGPRQEGHQEQQVLSTPPA